MNLDLAGRTALVLGGTRGLGFACATALAAEGVRMLVNGRNRERGDAIAASLPDAAYVAGDVGVDAERSVLIDAVARIASPDIIVTNTVGPPAGPFTDTDVAMWRKAFDTSIAGPLEVVRAFLPSMRTRGFGRIINITSFVVKELYPNMSLSNSVRVGLTGAMGALAREVAADGVTVNGILPGLMDTGALQRVIQDRMKRSGQTEAEIRDAMESSDRPSGTVPAVPEQLQNRTNRETIMTRSIVTRSKLILAALIATLPWTVAIAQTPASGDDGVKIGVMTDMSGVLSDLSGEGSLTAVKMAVEDMGAWDTYAMANGTAKALLKRGGDTWYFLTADYAFGHQIERDVSQVVKEEGGKVVGSTRHPFNASDFSSFMLQAQASGAKIIGLANGGTDTINSIKSAREFKVLEGGRQNLAGLAVFITDIHGAGLQAAQGLLKRQDPGRWADGPRHVLDAGEDTGRVALSMGLLQDAGDHTG